MEISPTAITSIVASIVVTMLIRHIKALQHTPTSSKTLEALTAEYAKWAIGASILVIPISATIWLIIWKTLSILASLHISYVESSKYIISPPSIVWGLPTLYFSLFLSILPLH